MNIRRLSGQMNNLHYIAFCKGGDSMYPADKELSGYVEKKKHGDELMPFVIYGTMMPTLFSSFPLHCHEELEMVLCDCGRCRYTVAGEDVDLEFGDVLVIMPWVLHSFRLVEEKEYFLAATYLFSLDMISNHSVDTCSTKYFRPMLERKCNAYCVIRYNSDHYESYNDFRELAITIFDTYYAHDEFFELRLKSLINELVFRLLICGHIRISSETPENNDVRVVRKVVDYISENYMENITLADLAELVNLSETGLSRLFRNITGMSCIDYVIEYRLTKAMGMLRTTDKPIIEVAFDAGFNNISYFNRMFKRHCHQTPSEFRKNKNS